jgi:hypothetical protein
MAEQRLRFLRRRQAYLVWLLSDLTLRAYERWRMVKPSSHRVRLGDIVAVTPDISPEDNEALATAARSLTASLHEMASIVGGGATFRAMALRLFVKFVGESIDDQEAAAILAEGEVERQRGILDEQPA